MRKPDIKKISLKDGHAPSFKLLNGCERMSESRDLHPLPHESPLDLHVIKNAEIIGVFSKAIYCEADGQVFVFHDKKWGQVPFGYDISVSNCSTESNRLKPEPPEP